MNSRKSLERSRLIRRRRRHLLALLIVVVLSVVLFIGFIQNNDENIQDNEVENQQNSLVLEKNEAKDKIDEVEVYLEKMTLEEKIAQLFIIRPEVFSLESEFTAVDENTKKMYDLYPVSGFVYFAGNLQTSDQVKTMLEQTQSIAQERMDMPIFTSIDEEGGQVARIGGNPDFGVAEVEAMEIIGQTGDPEVAKEVGNTIGEYLSQLGFNLDFAPVADVLTNPDNTVIGDRSFGTDPELVADMVQNELAGLNSQNVIGVVKHFPGHGATSDDTHEGAARTYKTLDEIVNDELIPFQNAIDNQVDMIMVGHFSAPNITFNEIPCSLSETIETELLRKQMNYDGVIITDALNMGAIANQYTSSEAAVLAIEAGNDLLLMPEDFEMAYSGLIDAVVNGEISEERIDESVRRILKLKLKILD